ncbi:MAG: ABC transporter substrate-binding protein [Pseudonocardiaceae bacterium]
MAMSWRYLCVAAALTVATLITSCAGGPDSGEITVACGATEDWCAANTAAFTQQTGINASYVRLSSGETVARLKAGRASPEFDVWHGGPADGYVAAADQGLLQPYVSPNASQIRPAWKAANGAWTGVYVGALGFCSNRKVLAGKGLPTPTSWADLLNPRYAGNISLAHPATSGTGYTTLWTQVTLAGGDQNKALSYEAALRRNVLAFTKSGIGPVAQVGRGEVATGIVFSHDCVAAREEGYSDLEVTFPREGTGYEVGGVAVIRGARNPAGASAYVDWALGAPAQQIGPTVKSYQVPTNPVAKVPEQAVRLETLKLINYDFAASGAAKPELVRRFDTEVVPAPTSRGGSDGSNPPR